MDKKYKRFDTIFTQIILLIVIIGMIVLGISVVQKILEKPEFIITKEECHNETDYGNLRLYSACFIGCNNFYILRNNSNNYLEKDRLNCFEECNKVFSWKNKVCEQKEVEEIEIAHLVEGDSCKMENAVSKKELEFGLIRWENYELEGNCYKDGVYDCVYDMTISKQDLTIEWFDEKCCCISEHFKGKYEEEYYNLSLNSCYKNRTWKNEEGNGYECLTYSCGDYTIEVKNG